MTTKAILDGAVVDEASVTVHVNSVTSALGFLVFEALRYYSDVQGHTAVFRLHDHHRRLAGSLAPLGVTVPFGAADMMTHLRRLVVADGGLGGDGYVKVMVFWPQVLAGSSLVDLTAPRVAIFNRPAADGIPIDCPVVRCAVSTWQRVPDTSVPANAKVSANYYNARLGLTEALRRGFDNAIFLDDRGFVAEAAESNVFVVDRRTRRILTPPLDGPVLAGITRDTVRTLAPELLGYAVEERNLRRSDLVTADEVFLINSAQLVRRVVDIDGCGLPEPPGDSVAGQLREGLIRTLRRAAPAPENWFSRIDG